MQTARLAFTVISCRTCCRVMSGSRPFWDVRHVLTQVKQAAKKVLACMHEAAAEPPDAQDEGRWTAACNLLYLAAAFEPFWEQAN